MLRLAHRVLLPALFLYALASVLHFTHNAEFVGAYPNLPAWITRTSVYLVWWVIFGIGVTGYALYRSGYLVTGLVLLVIYTGLGLDGLLHYTRAPMRAHTGAMNLTIWFEAATAALALAATLVVAYCSVRSERALRGALAPSLE